MSKFKNTKIKPTQLPIPAKDINKIQTYLKHGFVKVGSQEIQPKNKSEAFRLIKPNCNRRLFNMYLNHVKKDLN